MPIRHHIECDVVLPNGMKCETRQPVEHAGSIPPGWTRITSTRKATPADLTMLAHMQPMLDKARAKEEEVAESIDQMAANMLERHPGVALTGLCCPQHEMPQIDATACDHGCGVGLY